jgi:hypothetical protein
MHILIVLRQLQKVNLKIVDQHETVTAIPQSKIEMQTLDLQTNSMDSEVSRTGGKGNY